MKTSDLDYGLPPGLIAQKPASRRDASRLLVLERSTGRVQHRRFHEITRLLAPGSLVVLNDTRVFPARITGRKPTGGRMEVLLVRRLSDHGTRETWTALCSASGRVREGSRMRAGSLKITVAGRAGAGLFEVNLSSEEGTVDEAVRREGKVPLPPYIERPADAQDAERYQTVYARHEGSAAAPTAGLHFTRELLDGLRAHGHEIASVTLHVGPGTFQPVRTALLERHTMHEEWARIDEAAALAIRRARDEGRRIVACGTTVVRTLEGAAAACGGPGPWEGWIDLFIVPGHEFRLVDDLITNFHLPRSSLLALVMALAGRRAVLAAYAEAIRQGYRFYSYGDAMLVAR